MRTSLKERYYSVDNLISHVPGEFVVHCVLFTLQNAILAHHLILVQRVIALPVVEVDLFQELLLVEF